jgi:hypothetical protein
MSDATDQVLTRAYTLIESDRLDEARELLDPVLEADKVNADAWWLYAHAVRDREEARNALLNVLRVDPGYPDARDLLKALEVASSPLPSIRPLGAIPQPATIPDLPPTLPEQADDVTPKSPGLRRLALIIPILVLILVVSLLLILNPSGAPPTSSTVIPTAEIAGVSTLPVTDFTPIPLDTVVPSNTTAEVSPTDEAPLVSVGPTNTQPVTSVDATPEAIATDELDGATRVAESPVAEIGFSDFQPLYDALDNFVLPRESVEITQTDMGRTLLVNICTVAGPELRAALPEAMNAIASASNSIDADLDAIGARMLNCGNNTTLRVIGVPLQDAVSFATGDSSEQEFQASWRSL